MSVAKWSPLSALTFPFERLTDRLVQAGSEVFFLVTPYADLSLSPRDGGPFVSALLWACDCTAALRAIEMKIEADVGVQRSPPDEVLPCAGMLRYNDILIGLRTIGAKGISESAAYRIASDGRFVHRTIDSNVATYHFRTRDDDRSESPYAVMWKMSMKTEPNQPVQRNASTGSVASFESPARRG